MHRTSFSEGAGPAAGTVDLIDRPPQRPPPSLVRDRRLGGRWHHGVGFVGQSSAGELGIQHPDDLHSFYACCTVAPGQNTTAPAFWALQPAEISGPVYAVLLGIRNGGTTVTAMWKAR